MKREDLPIGMMDATPEQVVSFERMVKSGESPRMAEMLALRKSPKADTDAGHYRGTGMASLAKACGADYARKTYEQARKAGIAITDSYHYNGSVADKRKGGDPKAWLGPGDGRAKHRKVINDRGGTCESLGVGEGRNSDSVERFEKRRVAGASHMRQVAARKAEMADKKKA